MSATPDPERYRRVVPATRGGPPITAPSTVGATRFAVSGDIAFASTKVPANPELRTAAATVTACSGGQIEITTSLRAASASIDPASTSPAASARTRVSSLRPAETQKTSWSLATRAAPSAAPIAPGWSTPIDTTR